MHGILVTTLLFLSIVMLGNVAIAQEPALPSGLGTEPALPSGLMNEEEPSLPSGLNGLSDEFSADLSEDGPWQFNGFWEVRLGEWLKQKEFLGNNPIAETRLHLNTDRTYEYLTFNLSADLLYDNVANKHRPKLETGQGWLDLRVANVIFSPNSAIDIKVGRQVLTWGTGDLIFINDLFPKDWNSFLIGRDDAYLKAPSDAMKVSIFSNHINLDLVYTPRFDSDRYINGERVSYYNTNFGRIAGTDAVIHIEKPDDWFEDDELALRLYRNIATWEVAFYGYDGYWKSPAGANPSTGNAIFPRLSVYGFSLRGPLLGGIASSEWGNYHSKDDAKGNNPFISNSEQRLLLAYERELITNLTLGLQYYTIHMLDYTAYQQTLPTGIPKKRKNRHEISTRLTWLALNQKLTSSLYVRYSQSDKDYYLQPKIRYSVDDHWSYELGANIFYGDKEHTFFGQFENNDNIYLALRYGL